MVKNSPFKFNMATFYGGNKRNNNKMRRGNANIPFNNKNKKMKHCNKITMLLVKV
jgi:hypothetical protein